MMLPADIALTQDQKFDQYVKLYAADQDRFFNDFALAFQKLTEFGVDFNVIEKEKEKDNSSIISKIWKFFGY